MSPLPLFNQTNGFVYTFGSAKTAIKAPENSVFLLVKNITEYSCAAKPPVRKRGNRLSGRMETIVIPVWRSRLSGVA